MFFYLVRHGQTDWNNEKRMQGHMDIPMNDTGIQQMRYLADRIVEEKIRFDRLISSPLERARKSAEIIANRTGFKEEIVFDDDFIERSCGILEGEVWTPEINLEDPKYKVETISDLCKRAQRALDKYTFSKDDKIMIVAHGAILTAVRTVLSDFTIDFFDRTEPVIQGNVLCCERKGENGTSFFNVFK